MDPTEQDTGMTTLAEFLLARIADDESVARACRGWGEMELTAPATVVAHIVRHDPARVLAECEAKLRIVRQWQSVAAYIKVRQSERMPCDAIQRDNRVRYESLSELASVYADHPDYQQEWTP